MTDPNTYRAQPDDAGHFGQFLRSVAGGLVRRHPSALRVALFEQPDKQVVDFVRGGGLVR